MLKTVKIELTGCYKLIAPLIGTFERNWAIYDVFKNVYPSPFFNKN
jgi:hypothetical protein